MLPVMAFTFASAVFASLSERLGCCTARFPHRCCASPRSFSPGPSVVLQPLRAAHWAMYRIWNSTHRPRGRSMGWARPVRTQKARLTCRSHCVHFTANRHQVRLVIGGVLRCACLCKGGKSTGLPGDEVVAGRCGLLCQQQASQCCTLQWAVHHTTGIGMCLSCLQGQLHS
jgi:hypothetical protein